MTKKLQISTLRVPKFGGLTDFTQQLPSSNFITIFGSNEAGKSTLAEVIMWLIAGPSSDTATLQRFGEHNDNLQAELDGEFDLKELQLKSDFRMGKSSISRLSRFSAQIGGGNALDREAWLHEIGNTSHESLHAVHRIDGVTGHQVTEGAQVLQLAAQGMFGGVDPLRVADDLKSRATKCSTTRASGVRSIQKIKTETDAYEAELVEAGKNSHQFLSVKQQEAAERNRLTEITDRKTELNNQIDHLKSASQAHQAQIEMKQSEQRLQSLETVDQNWAELTKHLDELHSLQRFSTKEQPEFARRIREGEDAARPLHLAVQQLAELSFTDADLGELHSCVADLKQSQDSHTQALNQLQAAESSVPQTDTAQTQALAKLGLQVSAETAMQAKLDDETRGVLLAAQSQIGSARVAVQSAITETQQAEDEVQAAQSSHESALSSWKLFGTGLTAETWLTSGQTRQSQSGQVSAEGGWTRFVPVAMFAVLAATALVLTQPLLGVLAGLGLIITLALAIRTQSKTAVSSLTAQSDLSAATAAANAVTQAADRVRQRQDNFNLRGLTQTRMEQEHSSAISALQTALQSAHLPSETEANELSSLLTDYLSAQTAVNNHQTALQSVNDAKSSLLSAENQRQQDLMKLTELLNALQLPQPDPISAAVQTFTTFRNASDLARRATEAQAELQRHSQQVQELCHSVLQPNQVADLSAILNQAKKAQELLDRRGELTAQIQQQNENIQTQIGGSIKVQEFLDRYPTTDELTAACNERLTELAEKQEEEDSSRQSLGEFNQQLTDLSYETQVAELSQKLTALKEENSELAVQAAVLAVASMLLIEQAEIANRKNQPKLIARSSALACSVAGDWESVRVSKNSEGVGTLFVDSVGGGAIAAHKLSTGARAVLYLALRLAVAEDQSYRTGVWLPIICDDPLVHLDDTRAPQALNLLAQAAEQRQIILLTCNHRTRDLAETVGAKTIVLQD